MKIYIAGSSHPEQIARVDRMRDLLLEITRREQVIPPEIPAGDPLFRQVKRRPAWEITSTWTAAVHVAGGVGNPPDMPTQTRLALSAQCLRELGQATVLCGLVPPPGICTAGLWVEVGAAFEMGKQIVLAGDTKRSIYGALGYEFATDDEALAWLEERRTGLRAGAPT